jgi:hypothetical protein
VQLATPAARHLDASNNAASSNQIESSMNDFPGTKGVENSDDDTAAQQKFRIQLALQLSLEQHPQLLQQCSAEQLQHYLLKQLSIPSTRSLSPPPLTGINPKTT